MYTSVYIHQVKGENTEKLLEILRKAAEIYGEHGALECEVFRQEDLRPKYGCSSFLDHFSISSENEIVVELNHFKDKKHHDETMARIDKDPRISQLYEDLREIVAIEDIVRGEFSEAL